MKNIHIFTFLGIVILAMVSSCNSDKNTAQEQIITILHTNDIHGSYNPFYAFEGNATAQTGDSVDNYMTFPKNGEIGGFARIASAIKSIRS
ncbi:MAG: hypothetical protein CMB97_16510, partial [Flavobacteriaceae bacterium]|nr:hypothetical protein [Flavobacteriaceae bacterium]